MTDRRTGSQGIETALRSQPSKIQMTTAMRIKVECYAGYRGEETPRRVQIGDGRWEVIEILDRWLAPQHRYFKLKTVDGSQWIIRHDTLTDQWELTYFKHA